MLTLRFESESRGDGPNVIFMVETRSYRVYERGGRKDIAIPNENDIDIYYCLGSGERDFDRCFVMNSLGRTVARFEAGSTAVLPTKKS